MSMEVILAAVDAELLERIKSEPELLETMLFGEGGPAVAGFDPEHDVYGGDYRHMFVPYFTHVAEAAGLEDPDDFDSCKEVQEDPMYRAIMGEEELDFEFGYGPATYNVPTIVKSITNDWQPAFTPDDLANTHRADVELFLFYKRAADKNRTIICGIN